ncbi:TonB-dependent receptor [Bacteroidota bacterium]
MKKIICYLFFTFLVCMNLNAEDLTEADSIRTYRLGEITTTAGKFNNLKLTSVANEIQYYQIQRADASSVAELGAYIPSALIQTNSRGETLIYLRGAGERQLGLFFDGVLMNVPWDNRMDLSLIPTDIIGKIRIDKGAGSILCGPNILGGAINISTIERKSEGIGAVLRVQFDDAGSKLASFTNDGRIGNFNYIANIEYLKNNGFLLAKNDYDANLENQNTNSHLRTNTDIDRLSAYIRGEYKVSEKTTLGLSLNHISAEKGVAPLTEAKPKDLRFWRYPEWKRTVITANGEHIFSDALKINATLWLDKFGQTIDSYESIRFSNIIEKQYDDDLTLGGRLSLAYNVNPNHSIALAINGFRTEHEEIIENENKTSSLFLQNTLSTGLEYKGMLGDFLLSAGGTIDHNKTPLTGIFIEAEGNSQTDFGAFAGIKYFINENYNLFANVSRRTRFPTLRESFSGALGKFKVNPDLKPESGIINEMGISGKYESIEFQLTGFATFYADLIQKKRLSIEEDPLERQMRVNYSSATVAGIEASLRYQPVNGFSAEGHITYMYSEGEESGEKIDNLEYKPEIIASVIAKYSFNFGFIPQIELEYTGRQWGEAPDNNFRQLPDAMLLNFRLAYQFALFDTFTQVYLRGNNMYDKAYLSKIGLPNPGRMFHAGFVVRI